MLNNWFHVPQPRDPRVVVAAILFVYVVLGITLLGFNRDPLQVAITIGSAVVFDMVLHQVLRGGPPLFPFSALITGLGLSILVNYAHGPWKAMVPPLLAIASKYLLTFRGKHVYNPAMFGVVASLLLGNGMISDSPAYQWGGSYSIAFLIATLAIFTFVLRIKRLPLILSFICFYTLALFARAWITRWHMPMETLVIGSLTTPTFYLFTFFMITDPQTSPEAPKTQVWIAFCIVLIDFVLHVRETLSTLFYAAFICATLRFLWAHGRSLREDWAAALTRFRRHLKRFWVVVPIGLALWLTGTSIAPARLTSSPSFQLTALDSIQAGIPAHPGHVLQSVDPRLSNVSKWLLSVGDAVAVADVDNDGLQDVFLTYPLKADADRGALYRNLGGFRFERIPLPALADMAADPAHQGLPGGALFFDYDNDGDQDLLVVTGFGTPRLLQNRLVEDGRLSFVDVTQKMGLTDYTISVAAAVGDVNRDGRLDLLIGNAMSPFLRDYDKPVRFNIFSLPQPEYAGDRRMYGVMHRTWYDANNGGGMHLYLNLSNGFSRQSDAALGIANDHRWTTAIGIGDLDGDGWPDIYASNDFGPDQLLMNRGNGNFERVRGRLTGDIGHDTYKGMNVSIADFDGSGRPQIYVSNVHEKLQAEGSLFWSSSGNAHDPGNWTDQATRRNVLNERRFGWGAAVGDLDRDGRLDLLQANGMVDNAYDPLYKGCPDYWYWNDKIALTRPDIHGYADRWADLRGRCIFPFEANRVYLNDGRYFVDVAAEVGWTEKGNSRGIAVVDLDNDGDLDVLVTHQFAPVSIYRNDPHGGFKAPQWIGLDLRGNGQNCNRDAIGTRVVLHYKTGDGEKQQWREVLGSNGFSAQSDRRLLFGIDKASTARVEIHWCGDDQAQYVDLPAGRYHRLAQQ
jgi:hypothetical protein